MKNSVISIINLILDLYTLKFDISDTVFFSLHLYDLYFFIYTHSICNTFISL